MNKKILEDFISTTREIQNLMENQSAICYQKKVVPKLQFFALKFISQNKGITIGEFANVLMISSGAVAQLIERLVNKGWIKKEVDENDKRVFHLSLTVLGEKEVIKMDDIFLNKMTSMLSLVPEKDLEKVLEIYKSLLEKLKKEKYSIC